MGNVVVRVHDLLWISKDAELCSSHQPAWLRDALKRSPVVVVRRAEAPPGLIPVGIRGLAREQRHATFLRKDDVLACRTPESLVAEQVWHEFSQKGSMTLFPCKASDSYGNKSRWCLSAA